MDEKGDADCGEWSELIRDLTALGQRNIVLFLIGQIWSGYPDAVERPSEGEMLPVDSKVALAEIVSNMAEPGNPLSERLLGCFRSARALISKGYPQMGELMMLEGYLTITQFKAADLPNYNPESKWRAEILVSALQTMTSPTLPRA